MYNLNPLFFQPPEYLSVIIFCFDYFDVILLNKFNFIVIEISDTVIDKVLEW